MLQYLVAGKIHFLSLGVKSSIYSCFGVAFCFGIHICLFAIIILNSNEDAALLLLSNSKIHRPLYFFKICCFTLMHNKKGVKSHYGKL